MVFTGTSLTLTTFLFGSLIKAQLFLLVGLVKVDFVMKFQLRLGGAIDFKLVAIFD